MIQVFLPEGGQRCVPGAQPVEELRQIAVGPVGQQVRGAVRVQAAALSAVAFPPAGDQRGVAELSGAQVVAGVQRAAGQNRPAHGVAQREIHAAAARRLSAQLGQAGRVGVVEERAGEGDMGAEQRRGRVRQIQRVGTGQRISGFVQDARKRYAHAQDPLRRLPGLAEEVGEQLSQRGEVAVLRAERQLPSRVVDELARQVHQHGADVVGGDVQPQRQARVSDGRERPGLAPAGGFVCAHLLHQPRRLQLLHVLKHGGPAQVQPLGQLRLGDALAVEYAAHGADAVDPLDVDVAGTAPGHGNPSGFIKYLPNSIAADAVWFKRNFCRRMDWPMC